MGIDQTGRINMAIILVQMTVLLTPVKSICYLETYAILASKVKDAASLIRPELKDAYFTAIEYPVLAAEAHARKWLRNSASWSGGEELETGWFESGQTYFGH